MRVQLRDRNPPRGMAWKNGKGRARHHNYNLPREYTDSPELISQESSLEKNGLVDHHQENPTAEPVEDDEATAIPVAYPTLMDQIESTEAENDYPTGNTGLDDLVSANGRTIDEHTNTQHDTSDTTSIEYPHSPPGSPERLHPREWSQKVESFAPLTPPPSSYASSISVPAATMPYGAPNMYYPPPPWMQPFATQPPYPMHYLPGFAGYPPPSQQMPQNFASPSGSESGRPIVHSQIPWSSNGAPYPVS